MGVSLTQGPGGIRATAQVSRTVAGMKQRSRTAAWRRRDRPRAVGDGRLLGGCRGGWEATASPISHPGAGTEACGECVCDPRVGLPQGNGDALPAKQPPQGKTQPTFAEREVRGVLGGFVKCGWLGLSLAPRQLRTGQ